MSGRSDGDSPEKTGSIADTESWLHSGNEGPSPFAISSNKDGSDLDDESLSSTGSATIQGAHSVSVTAQVPNTQDESGHGVSGNNELLQVPESARRLRIRNLTTPAKDDRSFIRGRLVIVFARRSPQRLQRRKTLLELPENQIHRCQLGVWRRRAAAVTRLQRSLVVGNRFRETKGPASPESKIGCNDAGFTPRVGQSSDAPFIAGLAITSFFFDRHQSVVGPLSDFRSLIMNQGLPDCSRLIKTPKLEEWPDSPSGLLRAALIVGVTFHLLYLYFALDARRPVLAGICLAMAFSTRASLVFAAVFFYWQVFFPNRDDGPREDRWKRAALFSLPCLVVGLVLLYYNYIRFENPLEFGHTYLAGGTLARIRDYGLFHPDFLNRNLTAAFTLLPRITDTAPYIQLSKHGMSIFVTTPVLIWLLWPKRSTAIHKPLWIGTTRLGDGIAYTPEKLSPGISRTSV